MAMKLALMVFLALAIVHVASLFAVAVFHAQHMEIPQ